MSGQIKKQTNDPVVQGIIDKILEMISTRHSRQIFYGAAALNVHILRDPEILDLLQEEGVLEEIIRDKYFYEVFGEGRSGESGVTLHGVLKCGLDVHFLFDPANKENMSPEQYSKDKANYEKSSSLIIKILAIPSQDLIPKDFELLTTIDSSSMIKELKPELKVVIKEIESDSKQVKSWKVPKYTRESIQIQTIEGFQHVMDIILKEGEGRIYKKDTLDIDDFCDLFLKNEEALLDGFVIHQFYDTAHILGGLTQGKEFVIGEKEYSYSEILTKLLDKLEEDNKQVNKEYPEAAYEQILTRIDKLIKKYESITSDDDYQVKMEMKEALEGQTNGPINKTPINDTIVDACKLLFGPNKDNVEYIDGWVIYENSKINLTSALILGDLEISAAILAKDEPEIFYNILKLIESFNFLGCKRATRRATPNLRDDVTRINIGDASGLLEEILAEDRPRSAHLDSRTPPIIGGIDDKIIKELKGLIELYRYDHAKACRIYTQNTLSIKDRWVNYRSINLLRYYPSKLKSPDIASHPELETPKKAFTILLALNVLLCSTEPGKLGEFIRMEDGSAHRRPGLSYNTHGFVSVSAAGGTFESQDGNPGVQQKITFRGRGHPLSDNAYPGEIKDKENEYHCKGRFLVSKDGTELYETYGLFDNLESRFIAAPDLIQKLIVEEGNNRQLMTDELRELMELGFDPTCEDYTDDRKSLLSLALEKEMKDATLDILLEVIIRKEIKDLESFFCDIRNKTPEQYLHVIEELSVTGTEKFADAYKQSNINFIKLLLAKAEGNKNPGQILRELCSEPARKGLAEALLSTGFVNVNAKNKYGETALILASTDGSEDIVKMLLEAGANVNVEDNVGNTVLLIAIDRGHKTVIKVLLERGADVNAENRSGQTPLRYVSGRGREDIVKMLLEAGANVNVKDNIGNTALLVAIDRGHKTVIKVLLEAGADVNAENRNGRTPLRQASQGGRECIVNMLLKKGGTNVHVKDSGGDTALIWAISKGYHGVAKLLLDNGADVTDRDNAGNGLLALTSLLDSQDLDDLSNKNNAKDIMQLLFQYGADVNDQNIRNGETALMHYVSKNEREEEVQLLLSNDAAVDIEARNQTTALMISAVNGVTSAARQLIDAGAKIDRSDKSGETPLFKACSLGYTSVVELLLERRANPSISAMHFQTPLMIAAYHGHQDIVSQLVARGVHVGISDKHGFTASEYALKGGHILEGL